MVHQLLAFLEVEEVDLFEGLDPFEIIVGVVLLLLLY